MINQYVGEVDLDTDVKIITNSIKEEVHKAKISSENIKVSINDGNLTVLCNSEIANLLRKRNDIKRFRCNIVGFYEKESKND